MFMIHRCLFHKNLISPFDVPNQISLPSKMILLYRFLGREVGLAKSPEKTKERVKRKDKR